MFWIRTSSTSVSASTLIGRRLHTASSIPQHFRLGVGLAPNTISSSSGGSSLTRLELRVNTARTTFATSRRTFVTSTATSKLIKNQNQNQNSKNEMLNSNEVVISSVSTTGASCFFVIGGAEVGLRVVLIWIASCSCFLMIGDSDYTFGYCLTIMWDLCCPSSVAPLRRRC